METVQRELRETGRDHRIGIGLSNGRFTGLRLKFAAHCEVCSDAAHTSPASLGTLYENHLDAVRIGICPLCASCAWEYA